MIVIGRDLDGSDLIRFLMLSNGLRFFSLATAWSRPRSRIHLTSLSLTAGSVTVQPATRSSAAAVVAQLQPFDLRSSGGGK